ncbi:MAG TPA: MATE family efflux transporter [Phycisphaerales bacterium]|nr:MATE family efflux transporter [Phycisphaerales bacterium]
MSAPRETSKPVRADPANPVAEMLMIAAPSVVTMTSYTLMQFMDGLMVSQIRPPDPVYVAAQGNGGMAAWLALSLPLGAMGVVNTYVSQNLGAGRPERGSAYGWTVLWLSVAWALLLVPYALLLPAIFRSMEHPAELVALETQYAQINIMGAFFVLAARGISHYFYGLHRPVVVMASALAANVVNISLNALLIYGTDGPPGWVPFSGRIRDLALAIDLAPMGVAGAALATVVGSALELVIPIAVFLGPRMNARYRTRAAWRFSPSHVRDVVRLGWPAGLMFINEMLCWSFLMAYMLPAGGAAKARLLGLPAEQLGLAVEGAKTTANTAGWIALRYMHLSFMPAIGISIAVTALVGKCMGMGRPDLAAKRAWLGMGLTMAYMGTCALAFVLFREQLVGVFVPDELAAEQAAALVAVASSVMIAAAVFQLFDAIAITTSAALRGAGDTVWPGVATVITSWTCIVVVGLALLRFAPQLGSIGPWIGASSYIVLLGILFLGRFLRGRWKTIDVLGRSAGARERDDFDDLPAPTEALAPGMPGEA